MPKSEVYRDLVYAQRLADFPNQYIALFDGNPVDGSGTSIMSTITGSADAIEVNGGFAASGGQLRNVELVEITAAADDSASATWAAIYNSATVNEANMLDYGELAAPLSINTNDRLFFPIGQLRINETIT
jgi:hypothetical protein